MFFRAGWMVNPIHYSRVIIPLQTHFLPLVSAMPSYHMAFQVNFLSRSVRAIRTGIRLFSRVGSHMPCQVELPILPTKSSATDRTKFSW